MRENNPMDDMGTPSKNHPAHRGLVPDRAQDGGRVIDLATERTKRRKDEADEAYYSNKKILWDENDS